MANTVYLLGAVTSGICAMLLFRLFWCLAAAFWIFAVNYAAIGLLPHPDERVAYVFVLHPIGFVAILVGLTLKDRELTDHLTRMRDDAA